MDLPYIPGFPNYLLVTFYGLLTSFFPHSSQSVLSVLSQSLFIISAIGLGWLAYKLRAGDMYARIPVIVAALILPLIATPYALLHDMVILIPAFVLWAIYSYSNNFISYFSLGLSRSIFPDVVRSTDKNSLGLLTNHWFIHRHGHMGILQALSNP